MQMRNPHPPVRSGLGGWTRLLIVALLGAIAAMWLTPEFASSIPAIRWQLTHHNAPGYLPGRRVVGCDSPYANCGGAR